MLQRVARLRFWGGNLMPCTEDGCDNQQWALRCFLWAAYGAAPAALILHADRGSVPPLAPPIALQVTPDASLTPPARPKGDGLKWSHLLLKRLLRAPYGVTDANPTVSGINATGLKIPPLC